jgi:DNA-binding XRE family transcriptional regulator
VAAADTRLEPIASWQVGCVVIANGREAGAVVVDAEPTFAERLRVLRLRVGISQYELAKRSGVSGQAISRIEKGEREPGWSTVRKLARALGVPVGAFDVAEEEPHAEVQPAATPTRPTGKRK